ncbi:MAG: hypothetical protein ABIZ83_04790 [Casimicrobium sp.]
MRRSFLLPDVMVQILRAIARGAIALPLGMLVACTQAPTVPTEDPAVLHPTPAPAPVVVAVPPPKELESAMPAIPPVDGKATSVEAATGSVAPARAQPSAVQIAKAASVTPAGITRYECVKGAAGAETRRPIIFPEQSGRICARFPAMGPCQYERVACRASGGRVIRFDGIEITKEVEKEYDKQVQRFRLNAG